MSMLKNKFWMQKLSDMLNIRNNLIHFSYLAILAIFTILAVTSTPYPKQLHNYVTSNLKGF